jgi:hypothetical protein
VPQAKDSVTQITRYRDPVAGLLRAASFWAFTRVPDFHVFSCDRTHSAVLSVWQSMQALGLSFWPKRIVFSAFGTSSIWCDRARKSRPSIIRGMWQETQRLATDSMG